MFITVEYHIIVLDVIKLSKKYSSCGMTKTTRRLNEIQVIADVSDDYQPVKQVRSVAKRNLSFVQSESINKKPKRPKSTTIKCKLYKETFLNAIVVCFRCKWL